MQLVKRLSVVVVLGVLAAPQESYSQQGDARDQQIEQLQQQLEQLQSALSKLQGGRAAGPNAAQQGPAGRGGSPGYDPNQAIGGYFRGIQEQVAAQRKKIAELAEKHGADSKEVAEATRALSRLTQQLRQLSQAGGLGAGVGSGQPGLGVVGGPGGFTQGNTFEQMQKYIRQMSEAVPQGPTTAGNGNLDPAVVGQQMVIAGLEVQLKQMAKIVRSTEDDELRQERTAELKELAKQVVDARQRQRDRQIASLKRRLAKLEKEKAAGKSVEDILEGLLEK